MAPHPIPLPCTLAFPPPAIETPPRPVPAGFLISWPKNTSCSRIPPRASRASLLPRRWATTCCRLSLRPCTAPLSCSLQPSSSCRVWVLDHFCSNLSQSFHLCWITEIRSLNLCVLFNLLFFCLCFFDRNKLQLEIHVCNLVVITTAIPLLLLTYYIFLAVSMNEDCFYYYS